MITLPTRFNPKVSIVEDMSDMDNLNKDELYGILKAYEMRKKPENATRKEASFKDTGKLKSSRSECKIPID